MAVPTGISPLYWLVDAVSSGFKPDFWRQNLRISPVLTSIGWGNCGHPHGEVKSGSSPWGICPCLFRKKRLRPTMPETEADTCRMYVLPKLYGAGWTDDQINEQHTFTDGRVIPTAKRIRRGKQKRADYRLRYTRDFPIAIVEAKASYKTAGEGLQQAKEYADILDLKFAYATNGKEIVEFDFLTGVERMIDTFPSPADLWSRLRQGQKLDDDKAAEQLLTACYHQPEKHLRYYQEIAINRVMKAILTGQQRVLVTMATGTGKTLVAFQISWKLWNAFWNKSGEHRRPKILYLTDRNILIDDPKDKTFTPFGDARWKITNGQISKGREIYFAIYQAIAEDERRPGLYREYPPDFFDLIIVDECHRGSARDESSWREILEYFKPAFQLGMTATPKRKDNVDTYAYFGNPVYTYSLRQGIDDGFLAPYRVHRIVTTYDAVGWRPTKGELDRYGREIPDEEYQTKDFERAVALLARTKAIARSITDFLKRTDSRFAKTIVFCVDQEHATEMRRELNNLNADLVQQNPNYVCRVTADEGDIGKGHLSNFQDVDKKRPRHPDDLPASYHWRGCPDLQEHRPGPSGQFDGGVQADHRPWHPPSGRLQQVFLQHPRLHPIYSAVCRPRIRWRSDDHHRNDG